MNRTVQVTYMYVFRLEDILFLKEAKSCVPMDRMMWWSELWKYLSLDQILSFVYLVSLQGRRLIRVSVCYSLVPRVHRSQLASKSGLKSDNFSFVQWGFRYRSLWQPWATFEIGANSAKEPLSSLPHNNLTFFQAKDLSRKPYLQKVWLVRLANDREGKTSATVQWALEKM